MSDQPISFEVRGLDKLTEAYKNFPAEAESYMRQAAEDAAKKHVLGKVGVQRYPPSGPNPAQPFKSDKSRRYFFAALRRGEIEVPYRRGRSPSSERYGTRWTTEGVPYGAKVGNNASYAPFLAGENQSSYMARLGWRKLREVAEENISGIASTFAWWIGKLLKDIGIK